MSTYRIADLVFEFTTKYAYTKNLCKDYLVTNAKPDYSFFIEPKDIDYERSIAIKNHRTDYLESLAVYRKIISYIMQNKNGFFLHSASLMVDNNAYLFLAKSGVGKTTHIKLWQQLLEDKVTVINGDKPLIRLVDGEFYVYGTPWNGKERLGNNIKCKVKSAAFLQRSAQNFITKATNEQFVKNIFNQIIRPTTENQVDDIFKLLTEFFNRVKFYILGVNMQIDSAKMAYDVMSGE